MGVMGVNNPGGGNKRTGSAGGRITNHKVDLINCLLNVRFQASLSHAGATESKPYLHNSNTW